jgi:autotransporter-associated beta strand protein
VGQNVEARWFGEILIPGTGTAPVPINFATTSDDGSMLSIDGTPVVFNNYSQAATQRTRLAYLTPGLHTIDVEYYQGYYTAALDVQWDPTGGTNFVDIPNSAVAKTTGGLTMNGTGTLTLNGTNTFLSPTTVNAGKLVVNGQLLHSAVTVNAGGTLSGDGTVQTASVQSGGFLLPGNSPGTLTVAHLSLAAGATFNEELGGTTAETQYDQTVIPAGGSVALGSANLNLSWLNGFVPTLGQQFTLLSNQSGGSVNGSFSPGTPEIADAGFANPNVVSNGGFTYNPTGTPWTFTGAAGIESDGSAWGALNAPDGDGQAAFLQGTGGGTLGGISQSLSLAPGVYTLSFEASQRPGFGIQPIQFSLNGTNVGTTITPTSTKWAQYTTTKFTITTAGSYTLQLAATKNSGDNDSFIDDVSLSTEAATFVSNGYLYGLNYAGNGGHDVVLTVLASIKPVAAIPYDGTSHGSTGQILGVNYTVQNATIVYTSSTNQVLHSAPVDAGTYTATVVYPGTSTYPAASISTMIVISTTATSTSISETSGKPLTFTATVTDLANPNVKPTGGTVTFYNGTTMLKTVAVSNGLAKLVLTPMPAVSNTITAVYNGLMGANNIADYSGSTSPTGVIVSGANSPTATTLVSSLNPAPRGMNVTCTATVAAQGTNAASPSGTVSFINLSTGQTMATVTLVAGVAKFKMAWLKIGFFQIKAVFNPRDNWVGSSATLTQEIIPL